MLYYLTIYNAICKSLYLCVCVSVCPLLCTCNFCTCIFFSWFLRFLAVFHIFFVFLTLFCGFSRYFAIFQVFVGLFSTLIILYKRRCLTVSVCPLLCTCNFCTCNFFFLGFLGFQRFFTFFCVFNAFLWFFEVCCNFFEVCCNFSSFCGVIFYVILSPGRVSCYIYIYI